MSFASAVQTADVLRTLKAIQTKLNQPHPKVSAQQPVIAEQQATCSTAHCRR